MQPKTFWQKNHRRISCFAQQVKNCWHIKLSHGPSQSWTVEFIRVLCTVVQVWNVYIATCTFVQDIPQYRQKSFYKILTSFHYNKQKLYMYWGQMLKGMMKNIIIDCYFSGQLCVWEPSILSPWLPQFYSLYGLNHLNTTTNFEYM